MIVFEKGRLPLPLSLLLGVLTLALICVLAAAPAGAQTPTLLSSDATVNSVACPAAGACTAVGTYEATGGVPFGLLLNQAGGVWSGSVAARLPAGAGSYPDVNLTTVSCATAGNCAAVGDYVDNGYRQQGLMINLRRGAWRPGVRTSPPPGAAGNPEITLNSIACAAAGDCTAVGSYLNSAGSPAALVVSETNWSWSQAQSVSLPTGATASGASSLTAVSCPTVGYCSAVGWYTDSSGGIQGLLLTQTAGHWATASEAVLPGGAAAQPNVSLSAIDCYSAGNCSATGSYVDTAANQFGLVVSSTGGAWGAAQQAPLPSNAQDPQAASLNAIDCTGPGYCTAVGEYTDPSLTLQGMIVTESGGQWNTGVEAVLPTNAAALQDTTLNSVACVAYNTCVVAGTYFSTHPTGLLLSETAGRWRLPLSAYMPPGSAGNPYALLDTLACAPGDYCVAAGNYVDGSGNEQGVLMDGNGLYWRRGVEAPLPGGLTTALRGRRPQQRSRHR